MRKEAGELLKIAKSLVSSDMRLEEGTYYRVLKHGASISFYVSIGNGAYKTDSVAIPIGGVVEYTGMQWGRGHDSMPTPYFKYRGKEGQFSPTSRMGGIEDGVLEENL
jgi:hypothetical protein